MTFVKCIEKGYLIDFNCAIKGVDFGMIYLEHNKSGERSLAISSFIEVFENDYKDKAFRL